MKTYSFKLNHHWRKFNYLRSLLQIANEIYNFQLSLKKSSYQLNKKNLSKFDLQKLTTLERNSDRHPSWKNLNSQVIQQISDRIDLAYQAFFSNLKKPKDQKRKVSPPKAKPLRKQQSITFKQTGFKLNQKDSTIKIGKHTFKYFNSREVLGNIKTLTVKKNRLGEFFIYLTTDYVEEVMKDPIRSVKSVGMDFGLKTFLTLSNDKDIISPLFFHHNQQLIKKLSKELSSKKKGSHNRGKARRKLAKTHLMIANQRKDFHWKTALNLVKSYDLICLETLNVKSMQKLWGKKIGDLGFSNFLSILKYLAVKYDCQLVFVDRWFASSKTCSSCGFKNYNLELKDREWDCPSCKSHHDRDRNAAINIHAEGIKELVEKRVGTSTLAGVDRRPSNKLIVTKQLEKAVDDDRRIPLL